MKYIILSAILLIVSACSFGQQTNSQPSLSKQGYLEKSKNQKTTAWVLLGGGAGLILVGDLIGNRKESTFGDAGTGFIIAAAGALSMLGSIPLFIASGKNKRRAMSMSFKNEMVPQLQKSSFVNRVVPSLSINIRL